MNQSIRVSVVIPCFNHGEFLPEAVASVLDLKRDDTELIVVNDGSTDEETRREIGKLEAQGIRVIQQENKGLAGARNAGIAASAGEYILPLDADNRVRGGYIERGIQILADDPQVGVVYGDAQYIGTRTGRWRVGAFDEARLLEWNYIDACAIYRRSIWEQNSGYDGTMPVQGLEDWDFWLGALEHRWRFAYVPEILFDYRVAAESMITGTYRRAKEVEEFVTKKHALFLRQRCSALIREQQSIRSTARRLVELLELRLKPKLGISSRNGQER